MMPLKVGEKYIICDEHHKPTVIVTIRDESDRNKLETLRRSLRTKFAQFVKRLPK